MNTTNYADILPNRECNPRDAIEAISEKLPGYIREWLFEVVDFVEIFADRIHHIIENLPENPEEKRSAEVELAYIIHDLYINQDIVIAHNQQQVNLRSIELLLDDEGVLTEYLWFSQWVIDNVDISKPELFVHFLEYLASYNSIWIKDVMIYIQTCIRISQLDGWVDILMTHLREVFDHIPTDMIDSMIDENRWYLWGKSWDYEENIHIIMDEENLSYQEASLEFEEFQRDCAGFHFYLGWIYNEYILPKISKLPTEKQFGIYSTLNDLRDIVDPEYYIPLFFYSGNTPELIERNKILEEGREIQ